MWRLCFSVISSVCFSVWRNLEHLPRRYDFFAEGLSCTFDACSRQPIQAEWLSNEKVGLSFFPFDEDFTIVLPYKSVPKASIRKFGMQQAYRRAEWKERRVLITELN